MEGEEQEFYLSQAGFQQTFMKVSVIALILMFLSIPS